MPQTSRNAWRRLVGASAAAMLIASISAAASAQSPGMIGVPGVQGEPGPTGPQGAVGPVGPPGPLGAQGLTGPAGDHGAKGPTGPIGNVGQQGPTGPTGSIGLPGTNAPLTNDNVEILSGGTLGGTIGARAQIQLTPATGSGALPKTPIYMGPGNGASGDGVFSFPPEPGASPQASVQVPTPGGTAFNLQVSIGPTGPGGMGGVGGSYQFVVCNEMSCDLMGLECMSKQNTTSSMVQTCADDTDTLVFAPGDTLSILAFNNENSANTVDVSWSLDFAIDSGDAF